MPKKNRVDYLVLSRKVIYWLVIVMMGAAIFLLVTRKDANRVRLVFNIVQMLGMLFVLNIPKFIKDKYHFQIPNFLDFVFIAFAFCAFILGEVFNFYEKIPYWDSIPYAFSGIVIACIGFVVIKYLDKEYTIPLSVSPLFMSLIVVCVALAIGAVWEIGEYTVDDIFQMNNQQYMETTRSTFYDEDDIPLTGHHALDDTMKDLMLDLGGAIIVAAIGYKKLESKQKDTA